MEEEAYQIFEEIKELGGVIPAIEAGYFQRKIAESAHRYQREIDAKERIIVGVNEYCLDEPLTIPLLRVDPEGERRQRERLARVRRERENDKWACALEALRKAAQGTENLMPYILDAVRAYGTLGEICEVLREVFGEYREPIVI
jgi:methylmalonyl-CoA mutase N-terminal domain/subunit